MIRRRRPTREIAFSFDSFLDLVANVVGIIIRLILVVWVGARSYSTLPPLPEIPDVSASAAEEPEDDPLQAELEQDQEELARAQAELVDQLRQLRQIQEAEGKSQQELQTLAQRRQTASREQLQLDLAVAASRQSAAGVGQSVEDIRRRCRQLTEQIAALRRLPPAKQALHYRTPISAPVHAEEVMFECRQGRVTYIDLDGFMEDIRRGLEDKGQTLKSQWQVSELTGRIGPFALRYTIERERGSLDGLSSDAGPDPHGSFRYGVAGWQVVPVEEKRGETAAAALADGSDFRHIVDILNAGQAAVTFWVYPDSFDLFRQLRDYLYDRDIMVAGRPLPPGTPISASRHGSVSRGQ
jgi:hypothetical protein